MVDPQLDEFYIIVMSKINDQLQNLRMSIENIRKNMDKIQMENSLLKKQQENLVSEKADLVKKNELAKTEIQSILNRIKNMEMN
tara:strand:+ start:820 stop:1071 length:252 start_codon:yes stop_codon:yes gene_type:complete